MKPIAPFLAVISLSVAMLALPLPASAGLTIYSGDSYTFSFSSLPESSVGYFGYAPSGGFQFHLSDFEAGTDRLLFHLFEDSPNELSVAGGMAEAAVDGTGLPDAFADFDGGAVFTMLEGSVTLEDITFFFQEPSDETSSRRYTLTIVPTPVPEPRVAVLIALGMLVPSLRRIRRAVA